MIGGKQTLSGAPGGTEALRSGTKNGLNLDTLLSDNRQKDANVFERVYAVRKSGEEERAARQQNQQAGLQSLEAARAGDPAAMGQLLKELDPTINAAINSMVNNDARYKTRARLLAIEAIKNYDPSRGTELSTHVYNRLQGLRRIAADRGNFIHVPEKSALERKRLEEIKNDYIIETGVEPSLGELADRSGMPIKKVGRLMSVFGTTSTSMTRGESGDSLEAKPRTATELYNDAFYAGLPEMDKKIYEWSTGYQGSPQLDRATIARRLGVSEAAISQHVKRIDQQAARFDQSLSGVIYGSE